MTKEFVGSVTSPLGNVSLVTNVQSGREVLPNLDIRALRAKVQIEANDGHVYEVEFYAEDDWPLLSLLSISTEVVDATPPGAGWAEHEAGRRCADLTLRGLARITRD